MSGRTSRTNSGVRDVQLPGERLPVTYNRLRDIRIPSDAQIAPDGHHVAFQVAEWVHDQPKLRTRIWLASTQDGSITPLTTGDFGDTNPVWSPDGQWIAFLANRGAEDGQQAQVYVVPSAGGAARRVCRMPNGAIDLLWSPDGRYLAFVSPAGKDPSREPQVNEAVRHRQLWIVQPTYDTAQPVTPDTVSIWNFAWSHDSSQLAVYFSADAGENAWYRGQVGIVAAGGGLVTQLGHLDRQAAALAWSRDGSRVYYVSGEWSDRGLTGGDIFEVAVNGGDARNLTPGVEFSPSWMYELDDGRHLLYCAWDGLGNHIGLLDRETLERTILDADLVLAERSWPRLSISPDLTHIAAVCVDDEVPQEVWSGQLDTSGSGTSLELRRLTHLNPIPEQTLVLAPSEKVQFAAPDGLRIDALFTPPLHPLHGDPPPLVVYVHGGPTTAFKPYWMETVTQLLADAGFAVLRANIRGSMGRGVAFADAVLGDMGGKDFEDLLAGVDALASQRRIDAERVGIYGWSYGGFMTAWAVTHSQRFRAAVMGAGICDFLSFHAQSNIPDWDERFIKADPVQTPESYRERSAIWNAAQVHTPTLIIHGEDDPCVPVSQAYAFYRALKARSVPTELAVYPREVHGFRERDHLRDVFERLVRWFETYLV